MISRARRVGASAPAHRSRAARPLDARLQRQDRPSTRCLPPHRPPSGALGASPCPAAWPESVTAPPSSTSSASSPTRSCSAASRLRPASRSARARSSSVSQASIRSRPPSTAAVRSWGRSDSARAPPSRGVGRPDVDLAGGGESSRCDLLAAAVADPHRDGSLGAQLMAVGVGARGRVDVQGPVQEGDALGDQGIDRLVCLHRLLQPAGGFGLAIKWLKRPHRRRPSQRQGGDRAPGLGRSRPFRRFEAGRGAPSVATISTRSPIPPGAGALQVATIPDGERQAGLELHSPKLGPAVFLGVRGHGRRSARRGGEPAAPGSPAVGVPAPPDPARRRRYPVPAQAGDLGVGVDGVGVDGDPAPGARLPKVLERPEVSGVESSWAAWST